MIGRNSKIQKLKLIQNEQKNPSSISSRTKFFHTFRIFLTRCLQCFVYSFTLIFFSFYTFLCLQISFLINTVLQIFLLLLAEWKSGSCFLFSPAEGFIHKLLSEWTNEQGSYLTSLENTKATITLQKPL